MPVTNGAVGTRLLERARVWLNGFTGGLHVQDDEASLVRVIASAVAGDRQDLVDYVRREAALRSVEGDFWRGYRVACFAIAFAVEDGEHAKTPGNDSLSGRTPVVVAHVQQPDVTPDGRSPSGETDPGHVPLATAEAGPSAWARARAQAWIDAPTKYADEDDHTPFADLAGLLDEVRAEGFKAGRETPKTREEVLTELTANMTDEQRRAFVNCAAPAFPTGAQVFVTIGAGPFTPAAPEKKP